MVQETSTHGCEGLTEVAEGGGLSAGSGVAILNSGHGQELLGSQSAHEGSTTWGGDEAHKNGTAGSGDLAWDGVWLSHLVTPVSTTDGDDGELGVDETAADGGGDLTSALDTETDVTVVVTDGNESLEASALTGVGLLLHRGDLHDLVLELTPATMKKK